MIKCNYSIYREVDGCLVEAEYIRIGLTNNTSTRFTIIFTFELCALCRYYHPADTGYKYSEYSIRKLSNLITNIWSIYD